MLHRGAKFDIERLTFVGNAGKELSRECIRHPGSVIILPLIRKAGEPSPQVVMIRNWRLSTERWMWELPAGTMTAGEAAAECAKRELEEETGFIAAEWRALRSFHTALGLTDEFMQAFVAEGLSPTRQRLEADERIEVRVVGWEEAMGMAWSDEITDAKTLLVLMLAAREIANGK